MDALKPEGIRGLLLGPLVLLTELVGVLIPGVLFLILLAVKGVPEVKAALALTVIGYRTKMACGLLIAFIIGRVFFTPAMGIYTQISKRGFNVENLIDLKKPGSIFDKLNNEGRHILSGFILKGFLQGATTWEYHAVWSTDATSRISTGLSLIVASLIPGDGRLRIVEAVVGCFLLLSGIQLARGMRLTMLALMSTNAIDSFFSLNEQQRSTAWTFIKAIFLAPPTPAKTEDKPTGAAQTPAIEKKAESNPPLTENLPAKDELPKSTAP